MNTALQIAVALTAVDHMSSAIGRAVAASDEKLTAFARKQQKLMQSMAQSTALFGSGQQLLSSTITPTIEAYKELEASHLSLKATMLQAGGVVNPYFEQLSQHLTDLSVDLPGTAAEYEHLGAVMINNGVAAQTMLDGTAKAAAYFKVLTEQTSDEAGRQIARISNAYQIAGNDMIKFTDNLNRTIQTGVAPVELSYSLSKEASAAKLLGLDNVKDMSKLNLINRMLIVEGGMSGETAGTSFGKNLLATLDAQKMAQFQNMAAYYGKQVNFYDESGKFSLDNFMASLSSLKDLDNNQKLNLLQLLGGEGGEDLKTLITLTELGTRRYNELGAMVAAKADIFEQMGVKMSGLAAKTEAAEGNFTNLKAAIGAAWANEIKASTDVLSDFYSVTTDFIKEHPNITKIATAVIGLSAAGLMLAGSIGLLSTAIGLLDLSAMSYGIFALRYFIKFSLVPTIESAATAFGGMATATAAIGTAVLGIAGAVGAVLIYKQFLDAAAKLKDGQVAANPETEKSRMIKGYDEIINNPENGAIKRFLAYGMQAGIIGNTYLFGDKSQKVPDSDLYHRGGMQKVDASTSVTINGNLSPQSMDDLQALLKKHQDLILQIVNKNNANNARLSFGADGAW